MAANHGRQAIPTKLTVEQFEQFILPHLSRGRRGPPPTLPLEKMFNYVLKALYMGCQVSDQRTHTLRRSARSVSAQVVGFRAGLPSFHGSNAS
jgi:hypothetical protein